MRTCVFIISFLGTIVGLYSEVILTFGDPETFTDFEYSQTRRTVEVEFFSKELKFHLDRTVKKALPEGVVLKLDFQDIDLAGGFEPWQSVPLDDVRFYRSRYPPMVKFLYQVKDGEGNILAEGAKTLRELAYQDRFSRRTGVRQAFYYERRMLEYWIDQKLVEELSSSPDRR